MSSTLTEAVGTDTFGGLSGYKRDLQGNPTRVPSNLPAFRGRSNKPGAEIRAPMAITVIGGLLVSTLLTLVLIPVVYTLFDRGQ